MNASEASWRPDVVVGHLGERRPLVGMDRSDAFPLSEYRWESHLDLSFADDHRELLPPPWLMRNPGPVETPRRTWCQWPLKSAHFWSLKSAHFGGAAAEGAERVIHGTSGHNGTAVLLHPRVVRPLFCDERRSSAFGCIRMSTIRFSVPGTVHGDEPKESRGSRYRSRYAICGLFQQPAITKTASVLPWCLRRRPSCPTPPL